jgi:hypothetical protein
MGMRAARKASAFSHHRSGAPAARRDDPPERLTLEACEPQALFAFVEKYWRRRS